jgi:hypothetical protein
MASASGISTKDSNSVNYISFAVLEYSVIDNALVKLNFRPFSFP